MKVKDYEWTKRVTDPRYIMKARFFNSNELAQKLLNTTPDVRDREEYADAEDVFIELTMSCDVSEALRAMKLFERDAIAYGLETKNKDWAFYFLAAYDLKNRLTEAA